MSLRSMGIAPRASLGFSLIALIVVILGLISLQKMQGLNLASTRVLGQLTDTTGRFRTWRTSFW